MIIRYLVIFLIQPFGGHLVAFNGHHSIWFITLVTKVCYIFASIHTLDNKSNRETANIALVSASIRRSQIQVPL